MTENGVLRIVGNPGYRNTPGCPSFVSISLSKLCELPGYEYWPDDVSILDASRVNVARLATSAQVTDSYLLALAVAHGGQLATLDGRIISDAVIGGKQALHLIR